MEEHSILKKGLALSLNDEYECHIHYKTKAQSMMIKVARQDIIDSENIPPGNAIQLVRWATNIEKAFFSNKSKLFEIRRCFHPSWNEKIPFKDLAKKALQKGLESTEGFEALCKIVVGLDYVYDRSGIHQKIVL